MRNSLGQREVDEMNTAAYRTGEYAADVMRRAVRAVLKGAGVAGAAMEGYRAVDTERQYANKRITDKARVVDHSGQVGGIAGGLGAALGAGALVASGPIGLATVLAAGVAGAAVGEVTGSAVGGLAYNAVNARTKKPVKPSKPTEPKKPIEYNFFRQEDALAAAAYSSRMFSPVQIEHSGNGLDFAPETDNGEAEDRVGMQQFLHDSLKHTVPKHEKSDSKVDRAELAAMYELPKATMHTGFDHTALATAADTPPSNAEYHDWFLEQSRDIPESVVWKNRLEEARNASWSNPTVMDVFQRFYDEAVAREADPVQAEPSGNGIDPASRVENGDGTTTPSLDAGIDDGLTHTGRTEVRKVAKDATIDSKVDEPVVMPQRFETVDAKEQLLAGTIDSKLVAHIRDLLDHNAIS